MLQSPPNNRRHKKNLLNRARWAGYAAAGAATVLGTNEVVEADIQGGFLGNYLDSQNSSFLFDVNGDTLPDFSFFRYTATYNGNPYGVAGVQGLGAYDSVVGQIQNGWPYVSNLDVGFFVGPDAPFVYGGFMAADEGFQYSQFAQAGIGQIGFTFEAADGGQHFGWVRVKMTGPTDNSFQLLDFEWQDEAGVGIPIAPVPEPGSLGLFATGAIGLLLWRRSRRSKRATAANS